MISREPHYAQQEVTGFKSPADDYLQARLNIADRLVIDPLCTYYCKMDSSALQARGIMQGDLLIIDRALKPVDNTLVVCVVNGAFYCRCYCSAGGVPVLRGDGDEYSFATYEILLWGVVTVVCRNVLPRTLLKGKYAYVCAL